MPKPTLPPSQIQTALRCAALCDTKLCSENWLRAFWYEADWAEGVAMAKFDNGAGDHVFAFFCADGSAIIKGFDHESAVSPYAQETFAVWPGLYEGVPAKLFALLQDASVEHDTVTFCCWSSDGVSWQSGTASLPAELDDGSGWLLPMVQMSAAAFIDWAMAYYEEDFEILGTAGVMRIFQPEP